MSFLNQLEFSGRFQALRLGFIVDKLKISPCIHGMINDLLAEEVDFLILDISKAYRIEEGYFDLIIADSSIDSIYECIDQWIFLISGGGLLLEIAGNTKKYHAALSLVLLGVVHLSLKPDQITCKGFLYKNDEY